MTTSFSDKMPFSEWCDKAKGDLEELKNFRTNLEYASVIPVSYSHQNGQSFLDRIKEQYPHLLDGVLIDKFLRKQDLGNPPMFEYEEYGKVDPMVWRFIFLLGRIVEHLGQLDGLSICEIGPGNGILFKIITDAYPDVRYTMIDLEGPMWFLQKNVEYYGRESNVKKYLGCQEVMSETYQGDDFDMVLSECAYNECYLETQKVYMEKILNRSARGRILCSDSLWTTNNRDEPHWDHKEIFDNIQHTNKEIVEDGDTGQAIFWHEEE
ncbi:MAG: hypothetical protein IMZ53_01400 [Thermoplasmata archaeon]|nr:hypothetical protein [Thermoplasmata archaeon]